MNNYKLYTWLYLCEPLELSFIQIFSVGHSKRKQSTLMDAKWLNGADHRNIFLLLWEHQAPK